MAANEKSLGAQLKIPRPNTGLRDRRIEVSLACDIVRLLDGLSIHLAQRALTRAKSLLVMTQTVNRESALLTFAEEDVENALDNV
jgi:hypothetical protein